MSWYYILLFRYSISDRKESFPKQIENLYFLQRYPVQNSDSFLTFVIMTVFRFLLVIIHFHYKRIFKNVLLSFDYK